VFAAIGETGAMKDLVPLIESEELPLRHMTGTAADRLRDPGTDDTTSKLLQSNRSGREGIKG